VDKRAKQQKRPANAELVLSEKLTSPPGKWLAFLDEVDELLQAAERESEQSAKKN
jgi:hypothetical protein